MQLEACNLTSQVDRQVTPNLYSHTCLQICSVKILKNNGELCKDINLMLDSGSDRSYITTSLIKRVKPIKLGKVNIAFNSFGGEASSKPKLRSVYTLDMVTDQDLLKQIEVIEVRDICRPIIATPLPQRILKRFQSVKFNSPYACKSTGELKIDILVGINQYWNILMESPPPLKINSLVMQPSVFGWLISGSVETSSNNVSVEEKALNLTCSSNATFVSLSVSDEQLASFWSLETVGIVKDEQNKSLEKNPAWTQFVENLEYSHSLRAYKVSLPWRSLTIRASLGNNFLHALKRLQHLHKKSFSNDPILQSKYYAVFQKYFENKIAEVIPPHEIKPYHLYTYPVFYLPHRAVIKIGSSSPIRPVFDASAATSTGVSLNDAVNSGPSLYPDLVEVLIRFRRWPIALSGDICQAFLQVHVNEVDCNVHRFLLFLNGKLTHCRFKRVPFGNTCSPFLLNATIKYHLSLYPKSRTVTELLDNLFVDNILTGADTHAEAEEIYEKACKILREAGFVLDKWSSNDGKLLQVFNENQVCVLSQKYLGLEWHMLDDKIVFKNFLNVKECMTFTKRSMLSLISSIFDPLGLIAPYVLYGKILFQRIWRLGPQQKWDSPLPEELSNSFRDWLHSSVDLNQFYCPRSYFSHSWRKTANSATIVVFGDASEAAYGAVAYLRTWSQELGYTTSFITSKTRVAPVKSLTLPRLELMGALLAARLAVFCKIALKLDDAEVQAYTDSTIALNWIKGDAIKFKTFIANRIISIQEKVPADQWYHCPGSDNPADLASRGILAKDLVDCKKWLNGPDWMKIHKVYPKSKESTPCQNDIELEVKVVNMSVILNIDETFEFKKISSYHKIIRIIAYINRFKNNCRLFKAIKQTGPLTSAETDVAKETLWKLQQARYYPSEVTKLQNGEPIKRDSKILNLSPYLDSRGILRVKGRLHNSKLDFAQKHPIILPNTHVSLLLIRAYHLLYEHAGVDHVVSQIRESFWIVKARRIAKTVVRYCVPCQKINSRPCNQVAPPLPEYRVVQNRPFSVVGLDFAGPLSCKGSNKKWYILLITCASVRAVHLEMTPSQNLTDFFNCFSKFTSRRGIPDVVISDNFKTFQSASQDVLEKYGPLAPKWKFITPKAPWHGGWYERLVRSVKNGLKKSLGLRSLNRNDLEVALYRIERSINFRPITKSVDQTPLRPADFLYPSCGYSEAPSKDPDREILEKLYSQQRKAVAEVWSRWKREYITNLPLIVPKHFENGDLKLGDLVMVNEKDHHIKQNRLLWPLGRITKLLPGKDNKIRSVELQTPTGSYTRAIQRLHKIELSPHEFQINQIMLTSSKLNKI